MRKLESLVRFTLFAIIEELLRIFERIYEMISLFSLFFIPYLRWWKQFTWSARESEAPARERAWSARESEAPARKRTWSARERTCSAREWSARFAFAEELALYSNF
ncbi:hypothetical protein A374_15579 [Fictibacillus macauensis ZFHKF-1]|uniref:Uncharacterized protein n=1 Tax=Fictibacillus macauensis ZFHKF-1 TaxID=1196324 RepID=I8AFJ1_9BACL|nr:hypothetical protein [Fictibacillus macauensis]EIT84402.1 hypothetical protein A374_15579 [Fictibacillus macauensis ZFHKF-1]